jgi:uncharacterized lipoprotein YddW (UPF0748 family)
MMLTSWCHLEKDFTGTEEETKRRLEEARAAGIEMLFPFVADKEQAYYDSRFTERKTDGLAKLLRLAKPVGIEIHPIVIPAAEYVSTGVDTSAMRYRSGAPGGIFCDGRPCMSWPYWHEVGLQVIDELLDIYELDGIHLDVIRYHDTGQSLNWPCQCERCREGYREVLGTEQVSAEELALPGAIAKFLDFRRGIITPFVQAARERTRAAGVAHSMAARADYFGAALVEGQDWAAWARDGLYDFIAPMSYTTDRQRHRDFIRMQVAVVDGATPVYDGVGRLSSAGELSPAQMREQMEDGAEEGADGVAIFQFTALGPEDFREIRAFARNARAR